MKEDEHIKDFNNQVKQETEVNNEELLTKFKDEQNLVKGLLLSSLGALIGAVLWAVVSFVTNYQIGYMAIAVGALTGYAMRMGGKGVDPIFGYSAAALAFLGCLMGNIFTTAAFIAKELKSDIFTGIGKIFEIGLDKVLAESFSGMNLLFYGFAIYEGYKFAFRKIKEE